MFTPKLNKPRSRYSAVGDLGGSQSSKKRTSLYTPQKKAFTPSGKQSFNTSVLQTSRVFEECGQHRLEAYGQSLPILVTECLALKDKHVEPSVHVAPCGWAWLVCGRRLLVWMYTATATGKTAPCHELSLPPSAMTYKADLVTVVPHPQDPSSVACLAVSPEGALRFWNNVNHEGSFIEVSSDLKGEQCTQVVCLQNVGFIVATTASSLVLVVPGPNSLKCRDFRAQQGMLTGISRRMSSFIFGGGAQQSSPESFKKMLPGEPLDDQSRALYVLCGQFVQKWVVSPDTERMLYQCNVEQLVRDCLGHEIWHQDAANLPKLKTWLLDMEATRDGVVIFAAGTNPDVSRELYYCIGMLHTEGSDSPRSFLSFNVVRFTNVYMEEEEDQVLGYRLLIPDPTTANAFLFEKKSIMCTSMTVSQQAVDKLEFYAGNDRILGVGHHDNTAIVFSSSRGLAAIRSTATQMDASVNESVADVSVRMDASAAAVATPSKLDELSMSEEETSRLKGAFLHFCRGNIGQAQGLVDEIFPPGLPQTSEPGGKLDRLVTQLSLEMINDFPASDPRWAETHTSVGSSVSLILIHQLEDKLKAHEYLIQFLKTVGIWDRLSSMPVRKTVLPTNLLLCEHAEKLVAARTLRELHTQHQNVVDAAISSVLERREAIIPASGLTPADVFYREVSKVHQIMEALVDIEEQSVAGELSPRETVSMITTVNTVIGGMLADAVQYRKSKAEMFQAMSPTAPRHHDYLPWTAADDQEVLCKGSRPLLLRQHTLTVTKAIPEAQDAAERGSLFQQLVDLTQLVLDGYTDQLEAIRLSSDRPTTQYRTLHEKYSADRHAVIAPLVKQKQYERAAALAEKYQDFLVLVQICEETDNQERLQRYVNQFQAAGFADFVFKWYLDEGKRGKLMTSSLSTHPHLHRFLQTGENKFMSWLQDISSNNFLNAHKTLFELGVDEKNSASKKRTLLSLSKLAALATEDLPDPVHNNMEAITDELDLLLNQEQLPAEVIENMGFDADNMRVFSPKELIELYVGDFNAQANEFDFKKALDLLSYVQKSDPDYSTLLILIWGRAILRDDWSHISADDHLDSSRETVFFKTVDLAHSTDFNLREELPSADTILNSDTLADKKDDTHFQFLIRACFEQIHRVLNLTG